jgi:hypothetical protein
MPRYRPAKRATEITRIAVHFHVPLGGGNLLIFPDTVCEAIEHGNLLKGRYKKHAPIIQLI